MLIMTNIGLNDIGRMTSDKQSAVIFLLNCDCVFVVNVIAIARNIHYIINKDD